MNRFSLSFINRGFVAVIFAAIVVSAMPNSALAASVFSDGFGTGSTDSTFDESPTWSEGAPGAEKRAVGTGADTASPNGDRFAVIFADDSSTNGWICRTMTTTGYNSVQLSYYWRGDPDANQSDDDGIVEYKLTGSCSDGNNGTGWTQLQNHDLQNDNTWSTQAAFSLPANANNTTFLLRFRTVAEDSEYFRVDGVSITGTPLVSNQTITVTTHAPASATYGATFPVAATASSGLSVAITTTGGCSISGGTVTMTSGTTDCVVKYNQAGNASYNLAPEVTETVDAQKKELTVGISAADKEYDGTVAAQVTLLFSIVEGDDVTVQFTEATFSDANVGTDKLVTAEGLQVSGTDIGNYAYTENHTAMTNADITPRQVTVTADAKTKAFGATDPALTYSYTGELVSIGENTDAFTGALSREDGEAVGGYDILQGTLALNSNYAITFNGNTFTITDEGAPVITLTGDAAVAINTGDAYTDAGATAEDNVDGDITASIVVGGDAVDINTAGVYVITYNVSDTAGNAAAEVTRTVTVQDDDAPVIGIAYSTTALTNGPVTATASANEDGVFTNEGDNAHVFTENGTFTFSFTDAAGNEGFGVATVSNIDAEAVIPTCPEGFALLAGDCEYTASPVAPHCADGYVLNETSGDCDPTQEPIAPVCPAGTTQESDVCVTPDQDPSCPEGLRFQEDVFEGGADGCVSETPTAPDYCESGVLSDGQCVVVMAEPGDEECPAVPPTERRIIDGIVSCVVVPPSPADQPACAEPLVMNGGECYEVSEISCPLGTTYDDASNKCTTPDQAPACPSGTVADGDVCVFVSIEPGACDDGYTLVGDGCVGDTLAASCPDGMHVNEAGDECVANEVENQNENNNSSGNSNSSGGGGGGGGSGSSPAYVSPIPATPGQVLGAATSCYQFTRNLVRGMNGADVTELQKILIAKGYMTVAANGHFGPATEAGVKAYQKANGLEQVGAVGPKTRALLNACAGTTTNPNQALIDELLKKLNALLEQIKALKAAQGN